MTKPKSALLAVSLLLAACASTPTQNEPEASAEVTSPQPTATATETTPEPSASVAPSASSAAPSSTLPPPSGRIASIVDGQDKATGQFGSAPAKLVLKADQSSLKIPEYALNDNGYLLTFMIDKKAPKKAKGGSGNVLRLQSQIPPAESFTSISSRGPKFVLRLPIGKLTTANLAMGEVTMDDKGKETVKEFTVIAPSKTDGGFAEFEITDFTNLSLQVTSDPPSTPAAS